MNGELTNTAGQKKDDLVEKVKHVSPESASFGAQHVAASVMRGPAPFAAGALAVGFLLGWLVGGLAVTLVTVVLLTASAVAVILTGDLARSVASFASYNKTYGALGGIVVFLVWLWITNTVILLGAELNAEIERGRQIQAGAPADREPFLDHRDDPN